MRFAARTLEAGYHISVIRTEADAIRNALLAAAGLDARAVIALGEASKIRTRLRLITESAAALDELMAQAEARERAAGPAPGEQKSG